jgi:PAS domain S-box-containing protein
MHMPDRDDYSLPPGDRRQISRWTVFVVTLIVSVAAAATIGILRHQAANSHRTEVLLTLIDGHSHRISAVEWQVISKQRVRPKMAVEMQEARDEMTRTFSELTGVARQEKRLQPVFDAYREYEAAVEEELRLIVAGNIAQAKVVDYQRVDPSFDRFRNVVAAVNAGFSLEAKEKDRTAFILSTLVFLSAAMMIGLLFWRFQRAHQAVELMAAEQGALRWSERRFRSLIQNASDVIILLDRESTISYVSASVHHTLGYRPEELVNTPIIDMVNPEDAPAMRDYLAACLRNPDVTSLSEFRFRHADGRWFNLEVIGNNHLNDPSVGRIVLNCRDITERKRAEERLRNSREQLRNLSAYLQSMREEERTNIAREIHDELGQVLTVLKMDASWLGSKYKDYGPITEKTKSMTDLIDSTIRTVKRICTELRPGVLDDLGLVPTIEWQAEEFQKRTDIHCEVSFHPNDIALDSERSTAIFRILQETLTNVIRHAEATKVQVRLERRDGQVFLRVEDNGKGITKDRISDPRSFGLIGMRERANFLGGEVRIEGGKVKGTVVTVSLPCKDG